MTTAGLRGEVRAVEVGRRGYEPGPVPSRFSRRHKSRNARCCSWRATVVVGSRLVVPWRAWARQTVRNAFSVLSMKSGAGATVDVQIDVAGDEIATLEVDDFDAGGGTGRLAHSLDAAGGDGHLTALQGAIFEDDGAVAEKRSVHCVVTSRSGFFHHADQARTAAARSAAVAPAAGPKSSPVSPFSEASAALGHGGVGIFQ